MRGGRSTIAALLMLHAARAAAAEPWSTRLGETGMLDVPTAEVLPARSARLLGEFRVDRVSGSPLNVGPFPFALTLGLGADLELGLSAREWGMPGDPQPASALFSAALKRQLVPASASMPGFSADLVLDRVNSGGHVALRAIASNSEAEPYRLAAFAGADVRGPGLSFGPSLGVAASADLPRRTIAGAQALLEADGPLLGLSVSRRVLAGYGVSVGLNWLPSDGGFRLSFGMATVIAPPPRRRPGATAAAPVEPELLVPQKPRFADDRPRFRLRVRSGVEPDRRLHYAWAGGREPATSPPGRKLIGPLGALGVPPKHLQAQPEQDPRALQLDARERRLLAAQRALGEREAAIATRREELDALGRDLAARASTLEERARKQAGRASQGSEEERFAYLEQQQARSEQSLTAAAQRARLDSEDASSRERAARALEESAARGSRVRSAPRGSPEAVAQALTARAAALTALEDRLSATRRRVETLEQLAALDERRLDATSQRLKYLEHRLTLGDQRQAAARGIERLAAIPPPKRSTAEAAPSAPTPAVVEVAGSSAPAGVVAGAPTPGGSAVPAPVSAVRAAAFLALTSSEPLRPSDHAALAPVVAQATKEPSSVLVWARVRSPELFEEGERRAAEVKAYLESAGGLDPTRVSTRVTVKPNAAGTEVVVSASRPSDAAAPAGSGPR